MAGWVDQKFLDCGEAAASGKRSKVQAHALVLLAAALLVGCQSAPQPGRHPGGYKGGYPHSQPGGHAGSRSSGYPRVPRVVHAPVQPVIQYPVNTRYTEVAPRSAQAVAGLPQRGTNPPGVVGLQRIYWRIDQVQRQPAQRFVDEPWLVLWPDGRLEGSSGCNTLSGSHQISGANGLTLKANVTRNNCGNALAQEAALIDGFDQVRSYRIEQRQLLLLDAQGQVLFRAHA